MIDVQVYLSRWPFRHLPDDETPQLVARLRKHGITQAWAGSFDVLLHKDVTAVNARLAGECALHADLLLPFGGINLALPDWEDDLRRCAEQHGMRGVRLHPNYHGYTLDDPPFDELLQLAAEYRVIIQMAVSRSREYQADASGAEIVGQPYGLASALKKLDDFGRRVPPLNAGPAVAHMYISNPLSGRALMSLFSTHPPLEDRINRLLGRG